MSAMMDYVDPAERVPLNREIETLAARLGDRAKQLRAHARLFFDLIVLPDFAAAAGHVEAYGRLADETHLPHHRWRTPVMRAILMIVEGRVPEARALADEAEVLARASGDVQAIRGVALHRFSAAQVLGDVEAMKRLLPDALAAFEGATGGAELGVVLSAATTAADDDDDATRSLLARLGPTSIVWAGDISLIAWVAETVAIAGERALAQRLSEVLAPHEATCFSAGMTGYIWMGVGALSVGRLAACLERWEEADAHFARAEARLEALRAPIYLARVRYERASALATRGRAEDAPLASSLLEAALRAARAAGLARLTDRIEKRIAALGAGAASAGKPIERAATAAAAPGFALALAHEGEYWTVEGADATVRLRDSRGLQLLAALVASPDREIHALELASSSTHAFEPGTAVDGGDAGELLDDDARDAYRERVEELRETIAEAEAFGDSGRRARAAGELEALTAELARAVGLGGRARRAGSAAERARVAVQRRLKDALARLEEVAPELGRQLARRIYTGTFCSYRPNEPRPIR